MEKIKFSTKFLNGMRKKTKPEVKSIMNQFNFSQANIYFFSLLDIYFIFLPVVDCMDDLAELDLAELSAIIELEDDMAPSSVDS